ncbi:hypothetical protein fugu_008577 [Takifugu bimaculatus]|uniref:PLAC domain-containing protein n=1 Tax=Takifugu bimaculatus TaxID=433685 RepID=A0A4Z2AXW7_9TELE|nr:hypothetical protein fugu_008577 [Takifugu bimaculatus]
MERIRPGLLITVVFLSLKFSRSVYITDDTDSLHQVLSEFSVVHPVRTNSEGRFLSTSVTGSQKRHAHPEEDVKTHPGTRVRNRRQTQADAPFKHEPPPIWQEESKRGSAEEEELFYNVTVFGHELHLRLHPNTHLVAPRATMEWWEESGRKSSQPIQDTHCFYTGEVSNVEDTSVAISNCDGLAGMIRMGHEEFFIEPLNQRSAAGGEEEEEGEGRKHVVYRSTAVIKKPPAVNQSMDDFHRGPLLGSLNLNQGVLESKTSSARRRRYIEEAELFNIEVLLAVDYSVHLFHGREHIQKYLLTFMNIVNEIYQDHSLGANINIVLVKIIALSASKSLEIISLGNPQKSLENVCGWSYLLHREQNHAEQHDHTIYLSRQEFGPSGMQGMEHDGEANNCIDDVPLGSIMSPRVQATFYRYHWSRCSWMELHKYLHTYDCLRDDPFYYDWPVLPQLPGFQYTMDQQCHFDFGPGYSLCTAYTTHDPCKQLWCSDYHNPFYCKTKKGPPLDGTKCAPGKHCYKGVCTKLTPDMLRQDGHWGSWSPDSSCSRTCGGGVTFRTRRCDNPAPANGGRTCFGNSYEFQLCNREECPPLSDFREDQCKVWNPFYEHEGKKHHWLPYQHPDPDERCRLYCQSKETSEVVFMNKMVHDGTLCSYDDPYSVCFQGECEHIGCDGQIASDKQEDRCGVCGGDNSSCKIVKGNFTRSAKKQGYLKILEIPKGARHLLIQEFKGTPQILALKNQETDHLFLNNEDELPESRVVIEMGAAWEYSNKENQDSIQTRGPLKYGVLLMVHSHGESKVTVSYKYIIQNRLQSSLESNLVQEDTIQYEWALKKWSHCSKPCGGGKQYTRFGCRRKSDGKMVHRMFCANINKPRAISRNCNTNTCISPRWVTGEWEDCSASCGQTGWQRRWVSCQQAHSTGQQQRSVPSSLCKDNRPVGKRACNRLSCPPSWRAGPWTPCSVSCGNGTQERQVMCSSPQVPVQNCTGSRPITIRNCHAPPCSGDQKNSIIQWLSRSNTDQPTANISSRQRCRADRSVFCRMEALNRYCSNPGYRQMCCKSCSKVNISNSNWENPSNSSNSNSTGKIPTITRALVSTVESMTSRSSLLEPGRILTTSSLSFNVTPPPTSGTSTGFIYVDYDNYDEYSSYDDLPAPRGVTTTTMAASTNTTLGHQVETAMPRSIKSRTTTPTEPLTNVGVPSEGHTVVPVKISTVPDSYTTVSVGPDDIIAATSSPNTTLSGTQPQAPINLTAT